MLLFYVDFAWVVSRCSNRIIVYAVCYCFMLIFVILLRQNQHKTITYGIDYYTIGTTWYYSGKINIKGKIHNSLFRMLLFYVDFAWVVSRCSNRIIVYTVCYLLCWFCLSSITFRLLYDCNNVILLRQNQHKTITYV
jgi:hypothetical protein